MKAIKVLKNKKGFTLVEIIVVLVIIGILVAAVVPSMLGFVEEARGRAFALDARNGMIAAQVALTEFRVRDSGTVTADDIFTPTFISLTGDVSAAEAADSVNGFTNVLLQGTLANASRVAGLQYYDSANGGWVVTIINGRTHIARHTAADAPPLPDAPDGFVWLAAS
jgi:prepilin-type N-terminal cleavage/methylation domain-containing protein